MDVDLNTIKPMTLPEAEAVFVRWLGKEYDLDALRACLATVAVGQLGGDPVWLLIISGPGNAKTETVQAFDKLGAIITSTISSEGALLSATGRKERTKEATGGLLRRLGDRGILIIKDVTSILSMDRNMRGQVLAALREIYDGRWARNVGTDGGQTLEWSGRLVVLGAVTTAWDSAHAVVSAMGDRFVLVRVDSSKGRTSAGRRAIGNTGSEVQMRAELAAAVAGVIVDMDPRPQHVTADEAEALLAAADLVTLARTGVEFDYRGDVQEAHAPEMPTRFAKQLTQLVLGGLAIGMDRSHALALAIRCARDSMPPMRLAIIDAVTRHPGSSAGVMRRLIDKPWSSVKRQMEALHALGVLACDEAIGLDGRTTSWSYTLREDIEPDALSPETVTRKVSRGKTGKQKEEEPTPDLHALTHISGDAPGLFPSLSRVTR